MDTTTRPVPVLIRVHTRKDKAKSKFVAIKIPFKREGGTKWETAYVSDPEVKAAIKEAASHLHLTKKEPYGFLGMGEVKGHVIVSLSSAVRAADLIRVEDIYTE